METTPKYGVHVLLRYTLTTHLPDGTTSTRQPEEMGFIFGVESQPPSLLEALEGARVGDRLEVTLPSAEVFGEHDPALIREIPREGLIRQRLKPGQYYRQMRKGCLVSFKVLELRPDTVLADFNKPMAGIEARLSVEVLALREADREEIEKAAEAESKRAIGCG